LLFYNPFSRLPRNRRKEKSRITMPRKSTNNAEPKKPSTRRKKNDAEAFAPEIAAAEAAEPSIDQIRDRAYEIFCSGVNPGNPVADWFQAERELRGDLRA
jgi:hypothetical protein